MQSYEDDNHKVLDMMKVIAKVKVIFKVKLRGLDRSR